MPRKHKGPPQESIDSILLALSRRKDLDMDTITHYLARLDEEWTSGAREQVLQLFRSNDPMAHHAAMFILSEVATTFDLDELEEFITDPTVSDVAKLTLAPLLKEFGSELKDELLIEYLNDPMSAMQQMQMRILELVNHQEAGIQAVLNDIVEQPVERRVNFIQWLGSSNDERAVSLLLPLLEGQTGKVVSEVIDALELLGPIASQRAIPALNSFIATTSNRQLKQQARTALGRLTMQTLPGTEESDLSETDEQRDVEYRACASFIDGSGAQLIMFTWQQPNGLLKVFHMFSQEVLGIRDCYGIDDMTVEAWQDIVKGVQERSFGCAMIPFSFAHALAVEARILTKRARRKLPISYYVWRPLVEGTEPAQDAPIQTLTPPRPFDEETRQLAQQGDRLFELTEFLSWIYEPLSRLEPFFNRYWATKLDQNFFTEAKRPSKRKQRSQLPGGSQGGQNSIDSIIRDALQELIDDNWRLLYEARLRRQAAMFRVAGRQEDADLASAVAAMLHPDSGVPVQQQPFLLAMMSFSMGQGPLRIMTENLEKMGIRILPDM